MSNPVKLSDDKLYELRVKHLEMIQGVISRIAGYGATLKNYCITLVTAICGLAVTLGRPNVTLVSLIPIIAFALIDAQYLNIERRFRNLFEKKALEDWNTIPTFDLDVGKVPFENLLKVLKSWSIWSFYAPLIIGVLIVFVLLGNNDG